MTPSPSVATVIGFDTHRGRHAPRREPKSLLEAVYSAGSVLVRPDDRPARTVAMMLARLGFLIVDEIQPDGGTRRLAGAAFKAAASNPWRVSKADLRGAGEIGAADAAGSA